MKAVVVVDAGICGFQTRIGAFKGMQVAAGGALAKDVTLKFNAE